MKHNYFKYFLIIFFFPFCINAQVVINEFCASNMSGATDNFGEREDWIELYNTSASTFDLSGYFLSDNDNNPTKWQVPAGITINANGYLRIWASGRDLVNGANIHTNFRLTQKKPNPEFLILADPSGVILESYDLNQYYTQTNHSYGRNPNGAATWSIFTNPTPGASNTGSSYIKYADMPVFNINGGFYGSSQSISISTSEPNSSIRYTTNGNTPDLTSTLFSGAIPVNSTTVIQARVFSSDPQILPSLYEFHTYFINENHTIPVISISGTNLSNLLNGNSSINPSGCIEYYENNQLKTKVTGEFNKHGNDSWAYQQRGIDFVSRDEFGYGDALHHKIFPISDRKNFQRIILKAAANDNYPFEQGAHIRDAYVHEVSQRANLELDERSYMPCVLFLNGQYWGVYETREKVDDNDFTSYYYNQGKYDLYYLKTWGSTWSEYGGNPAQTDWQSLVSYIQSNNMGVAANYAYVKDRLNVLSLIDYFIINTYTVCSDWLNWNTAWWHGTNPNGEQLKWRYTLWDNDATFGHYINYTGVPTTTPDASPCFGENLPNPGQQGHTTIISKLLDESPEFKQLYLTRYSQLINTSLSCNSMIAILDELVARIEPEMPKQIQRWGGNLSTWQNNVQEIRDFILQRCATFDQGFINCYNVTGPYNIQFRVEPAGAGNMDINQTTVTTFPFNNTYFGDIENNLTANANSGYVFSHWETLHHTLTPSVNDQNVQVTFSSTDTITAYFTQTSSYYNLVFLVEPTGAGNIDINTFTPSTYPFASVLAQGTDVSVIAQANSTYEFSHWSLNNHTILPSATNPTGSFTVNDNDTIIAHFELIPQTVQILFRVEPPLSGKIRINNSIQTLQSTLQTFELNTPVNILSIAQPEYAFVKWESAKHTLNPDVFSTNTGFTAEFNDTVTAYFEPNDILTIPGSFSPNEDGVNDRFFISIPDYIDEFEIHIYNRWGELIFSSNSKFFSWDGTFEGKVVQNGSYVYTLQYKLANTGIRKSKEGYLLILK